MKDKIIELLDEVLRFEELEKETHHEQTVLLNEIQDIECKLDDLKSKSILDRVMEEILENFQKTSQILENESRRHLVNMQTWGISQDQSRQLESNLDSLF